MVNYDDPFADPIIVQNTRILRPTEYKSFKRAIPKNIYRTMFDAIFATGMRYAEFEIFSKHPKWFNENEQKIYLPKMAIKKKKVKRNQRWIRLSDWGAQQISSFFNSNTDVPSRRTWYENLQRWGESSEIDTEGINVKMTRKTWECYLIEYYGNKRGEDNLSQILLSQGHTRETAINHYWSQPFSKKDVEGMIFMLEGWL